MEAGNPGSDARTVDYVIQHIMSTRAPITPPARKSTDAQGIHQHTTGAAVWSTQIHSKPQTYYYYYYYYYYFYYHYYVVIFIDMISRISYNSLIQKLQNQCSR